MGRAPTDRRAIVAPVAMCVALLIVSPARAAEPATTGSELAPEQAEVVPSAAAATATDATEPTPCLAFPGEFSGGVALVSDYVFRGVSQTEEGPALQGAIEWKHESGIYLGLWGSNVKLADSESSLETDLYGGYGIELGDVSMKIGALFYWYPKAESELDYWELPLEAGYDLDPLSLSLTTTYSPDYFGYAGHCLCVTTGAQLALPLGGELPLEIVVDGSIGHTWARRAVITDRGYLDWSAGATISPTGTWSGIGLGIHYTDTDIHRDDSDARVVGSVSYEL